MNRHPPTLTCILAAVSPTLRKSSISWNSAISAIFCAVHAEPQPGRVVLRLVGPTLPYTARKRFCCMPALPVFFMICIAMGGLCSSRDQIQISRSDSGA